MKVTNVEQHPNGLGFDATINGTRFEIYHDKALRRLGAWRLRSGEMTHYWSLNGYSAIVEGCEEVAKLVYGMWRDNRETWVEAA